MLITILRGIGIILVKWNSYLINLACKSLSHHKILKGKKGKRIWQLLSDMMMVPGVLVKLVR